jgi:RNA recognition motif-containing protein
MAGGKVWEDVSLAEWPEDDYRVFVGDLGNEVTDDVLHKAFAHYSSLNKVKVVRDKITTKSKGYGFVSLQDPMEFLKCLKEMNGVYIGNRPCKLKKSNWKQRDLAERKKQGKGYAIDLIVTQAKGTGKAVKKRKARPENANRDELRGKAPKTFHKPRFE